MDKIEILKKWIDESENIVFLTGAGISTDSGIPDFRGKDGIYTKNSSYEDVFDISRFIKDPMHYYTFYFSNLGNDYQPNISHKKIAELESKGKNITVVTQNIDGLHQKAGSKKVFELHGNAKKAFCMRCNKGFVISEIDKLKGKNIVPKCDCGGVIKPDVVFFGESLDEEKIENSIISIMSADMLIVVGSSLTVYPAAGLINYYNKNKHKLVIINRDSTSYDDDADLVINDEISKVFKNI